MTKIARKTVECPHCNHPFFIPADLILERNKIPNTDTHVHCPTCGLPVEYRDD